MKKENKHINIPVFIPHLGCSNQCVFCNQRFISGTQEFNISKVRSLIESALSTIGENTTAQIAFFGGSFTGIGTVLMRELLEIAEDYIRVDKVNSIRLSTRPDYISEEILGILSEYHVTTIELGIQSVSDDVLLASKRGHTFFQTVKACDMIIKHNFELVGQMMVGLPSGSMETEMKTAQFISDCGASSARVYPCVVFRNTELYSMCMCGSYIPLTLDAAIERSATVAERFVENNIKLLRIGLCESDSLHDDSSYFAGPNHPAIGELVEGHIFYKKAKRLIEDSAINTDGKNLVIYAPLGTTSKVIGNKKVYKNKIIDEFHFNNMKVLEKSELLSYNIRIEII